MASMMLTFRSDLGWGMVDWERESSTEVMAGGAEERIA